MKKLLILSLFIVSIVFLSSRSSFAAGFDFKVEQSLCYDISADNENWYVLKLRGESEYYLSPINKKVKISPFVGTRYHFYLNKLSRIEIGLEAGIDLFNWLYWGESLQYASLHPGRDTIELESILRFHYPFTIRDKEFEFYILEEHIFAFVIGEGKRNEIAGGFNCRIKNNVEALLGWRHIDRIHNYDSDQIEASVIIEF